VAALPRSAMSFYLRCVYYTQIQWQRVNKKFDNVSKKLDEKYPLRILFRFGWNMRVTRMFHGDSSQSRFNDAAAFSVPTTPG